METTLKRGEVVPNFSLLNTAGETVRRSAYRGRLHLILLFMPTTQAESARAYLQAVADLYATIKAASGEVLAVARDSVAALARAQEDLALPFQLLADDGSVTRRFVPAPAQAGVFIIDRYGELYFSAVTESASELPPPGELQSWVEAVDNQCAI